jgi:hypothetical protein
MSVAPAVARRLVLIRFSPDLALVHRHTLPAQYEP